MDIPLSDGPVLPGVEQPDPVPYTPPPVPAPAAKPTADEFFGKPSADDFFGPQTLAEKLAKRWQQWESAPADTPSYERLLPSDEGMKRIMEAFKEGYNGDPRFGKQTGLDDETIKTLRELGIFNDYEKGRVEAGKAFLEAAVRPAAAALEGFIRGMSGLWKGTQQQRIEAGLPKDLAAVEEAFMGQPYGLGTPKVPGMSVLDAARELKIIGEDVPRPTAPLKPVTDTAPPKPPHVEDVARSVKPETFERLDTLTEAKTQLTTKLEEHTAARDKAVEAEIKKDSTTREIARIEKRLEDPKRKPELRAKDEARLAEVEKAREDYVASRKAEETSEMRLTRMDLEEVERQLADLDPHVKSALSEAKGPTAQLQAEYNALREQPDMFGFQPEQGSFRFMTEAEQAVPHLTQEGKAGPGKLRAMPPSAPLPEKGVIRRPDGTTMGRYTKSTEKAVQQDLPFGQGAAEGTAAQREFNFTRPAPDVTPTTPPATPTTSFETRQHPLLDKDGNIRLKGLLSQNDVNDAIKAAKPDGAHQRRNVLSLAERESLAEALGVDAKELNPKKIGRTFSEEQIGVAKDLLNRSSTHVRDAALKAALGTEEDVLAYAVARERHKIIQSEVSRGLRDDRNVRKLQSGLADADTAESTARHWSDKSLAQLREEAEMAALVDSPAAMSKFIADASRQSWGRWLARNWQDAIVEIGLANILGKLTSQVVNVTGNLTALVVDLPDTFTAAALGKLHKGEKVYLGETKEKLFGLLSSSRDWPIIWWEVMRHEEMLRSSTKYELPKQVIPGMVGTVIRTPLRSLGATDMAFRHMAFTTDIRSQAYRTAKSEGLTGSAFTNRVVELMGNPTEKMVEIATKQADYLTFSNELGVLVGNVQKAANAVPLLKFAVPFVKVITNLLKYGVDHSVLAPVRGEVREALMGYRGSIARDQAAAKMINGALAGLAIYSLATDDTITGAGPLDPREREIWMLSGKRPYSIRLGDAYFRIQNLDPLANIVMVVGDAVSLSEAMTDEESEEVGNLVLKSLNNVVLDKSWASGLAQMFRAIQDPDRYGDSYMASLAGWAIPGGLASVAEEQDPYIRQARTFLEGVRSRIPGKREELPTKLDIFGEPMKRDETLGPSWLSPFRYSTINNDPVVRTLNDLGIWPGKVAKKVTVGGTSVDLTDEQQHDYQRIAGQFMKMRLDQVVNIPNFDSAPAQHKTALIKAEISGARKRAQVVLFQTHPDLILTALENKRKALTGE